MNFENSIEKFIELSFKDYKNNVRKLGEIGFDGVESYFDNCENKIKILAYFSGKDAYEDKENKRAVIHLIKKLKSFEEFEFGVLKRSDFGDDLPFEDEDRLIWKVGYHDRKGETFEELRNQHKSKNLRDILLG